MRRVELRAHGWLPQAARRRPRSHPIDARSKAAARAGALVKAALAVLALAVLTHAYARPVARIAGTPVVARSLLALIDESGSMDPHVARRDAVLAQLAASGMNVATHIVYGPGVSTSGASGNLLKTGFPAVRDRRNIDAVLLVSDFRPVDELDTNDAAGFAELRAMLGERGLRLYLLSVNMAPVPELAAIARESGGGLIESIEGGIDDG